VVFHPFIVVFHPLIVAFHPARVPTKPPMDGHVYGFAGLRRDELGDKDRTTMGGGNHQTDYLLMMRR
jgi:hypothetical protein